MMDELKLSTGPLAKAIRQKLQGNDPDLHAARRETLNVLDGILAEISPTSQTQGPQSYSPADLVTQYWPKIDQRKAATTTGFAGINKVLEGGFEEDRLVVLLGAPGSGKTTLTNHIANHVADSEHPVLYVTSEDTPFNLLAKTISRYGDIPYGAVRRGYDNYKEKITQQLRDYTQMTCARYLRYVDATQGITLDGIYELAQEHFGALQERSKGTPLIVVDYLQRLSRGENLGADARQSATIYVERLRAMACDLHCTVILLSAMNRASGYTAGNNTISSAKESGDIEYTADVIMALGPEQGMVDDVSPGVRRWMLRIDKNRQGETTVDGKHIGLDWCGSLQRFSDVDLEEQQQATYTDQQFATVTGKTSRLNRRQR